MVGRFVVVMILAVGLVGCPKTETIRMQAERIEQLEAENQRLRDELADSATPDDDPGTTTASTTASGAQLDEGTMMIYDPDLKNVTRCAGQNSKNVITATSFADLPVAVIVTHAPVADAPRELWAQVTLKGDCARSYELDRGPGKPYGILPDHFTGPDGAYDAGPAGDKHHRITLHRVHPEAAKLEKNVDGKYLVPKAGFESMSPISFTGPPNSKNDNICTTWVTTLQELWTDSAGNAMWDSVSCYTTPADAPKCDPGSSSCPD